MYTRILIPFDGSSLAEQVLPCGWFLAKALRIPVQLLRVIDGNEIALTSRVSQGLWLEKLLLQSRLSSRTYLEEVARSFAAAQVSCSIDAGNPPEVIIEKASADKNTLIVMATHGGSGIRRWLLGSVAHQLLQESANDMFLIRVTDEGRTSGEAMPRTAILPLDGSPFAEQVAPRIEQLAQRIGLKLVLFQVGVWQPAATDDRFSPSKDEWFHRLRGELHQCLGAKVRELRRRGLVDVEAAVKFGYAAEQIISMARETRNSFVAMCTHRGSGLNRWALGSVTNAVVRRSRGPVLVIRGGSIQSSNERPQEVVRTLRDSKPRLAFRVSKRQEKHHA
jgi:nucleotide-binding universal stress UspA family protein